MKTIPSQSVKIIKESEEPYGKNRIKLQTALVNVYVSVVIGFLSENEKVGDALVHKRLF